MGILGGVGLLLACDVTGVWASEEASEEAAAAGGVPVAEADRFVGDYRYSGGKKQRDALAEAIEDLVAELNALVRGRARKRLTKTNPVFAQVEIERNGDALSLAFDGRLNVCKLDGSVTEVESIEGSKLDCRLSMKGDELVQHLDGKLGGRVNTYSVDASGRLKVKVRIYSHLMPKDMKYRLTYAR
jgi:hypothetical protein